VTPGGPAEPPGPAPGPAPRDSLAAPGPPGPAPPRPPAAPGPPGPARPRSPTAPGQPGRPGELFALGNFATRHPWQIGAGCAAAGLALAPAGPTPALVAAALLAAAGAVLRAAALGALGAALLLAALIAGEARLAAIDAPAIKIRDGARARLRAELLAPPRRSAFGATAEIRVTGGTLSGARLLLRAAPWAPLPRRADVGAELVLAGRLRALRDEPAPGDRSRTAVGGSADSSGSEGASFDFAAYLRRRGIAGELLLDRGQATGARRGGLAGVLDRMRDRAERAVTAGMSPEEANLVRGMVLGQDERISEGVREDFRASGLAHLLAVSGQNVMLLVALALPLLAVVGLGPRARAIALLCLIAVYVPLAGAGPSLQRAGIMGAAGIAAMTLSRPASRWYALLLAAAVTLALNPRATGDPGWQLSFAAVAGILTLGHPLQRFLARIAGALRATSARVGGGGPGSAAGAAGSAAVAAGTRERSTAARLAHGLAEGAAITMAASLATAPLLAYHFDTVPLAGLPANLLALPAVAPAMWLGMVKAGLGQLAALVPAVDGLAVLLGPLTGVPVGYLATLAEHFADVPGGQIALPLRAPAAVVAAYLFLAAACLAASRAARRLGPRAEELAAAWRQRPQAQRLAAALVGLGVLALLAARLIAGPQAPGTLTIRFLDVGQGDATLIQHPDGTALLFDGGPPEAGTARLLRRAGVRRLAVVVATHASRDHHGGLVEVLARFPVDVLLDGGDRSRDPGFRAVLTEARRRAVRRVRAIAPMTLRAGPIRIAILSPPPRPPGPAPEDPNPRAVVAVVSSGDLDLLLSADAESEALLPLDLPDVDVMKVPHHGSADPGLPDVLQRVRPELAAIEVGPNTYGHPTSSTLAALAKAGVRTYRTDRDGTVTVSVDDGAATVSTEH
jgi:competence protein ComEC